MPMFDEIQSITRPDTMAVVYLVDPVEFKRMVTRGLSASKRISSDGMQN